MDKKILEVILNILENLTLEVKYLKNDFCGNGELTCVEKDIDLLKELIYKKHN